MSRNEITGNKMQTKPVTNEYRDNYDKIFAKKITGKEIFEQSARGYQHKEFKALDLEVQQYYNDAARMREAYHEECDYLGCGIHNLSEREPVLKKE